jgi:hypothetical protein
MDYRNQIIDILQNCILSSATCDYEDTMEEIIFNLLNKVYLKKLIEGYEPRIYIPEKELKILMEECLFKLGVFFTKKDDIYIPKENVKKEEIERFLQVFIKIMLREQENKYIYVKFSTCKTPISSEMTTEEIEKMEKFVVKDKFDILKKSKSQMTYSITSRNAKNGLEHYKTMLDKEGPIFETFAYPASLHTLYSLYKSREGKIYVLHSTYDYIVSHRIIKNETWFRNLMI